MEMWVYRLFLLLLAALVEEIAASGSSRQPLLDVGLEAAAVVVGLALCLLIAIRFSTVGRSVAWGDRATDSVGAVFQGNLKGSNPAGTGLGTTIG